MMRIIGVALVAALAGLAIGVSGTLLLRGSSAATPQPDRVVGIVRHCTLFNGSEGTPATTEIQGSECPDKAVTQNGAGIINIHNQLTVRTDKATTYTVDIPISTAVHIGDPWPEP